MARPIRPLSISPAQQQELQSMIKKKQGGAAGRQAGEDHPRPRRGPQPAADRGSGWHQPTGGGQVGKAVHAARRCGPCRSQTLRTKAGDFGANPCRHHHRGDNAAAGANPMVSPQHGQGQRRFCQHRTATLARQRHQAARHAHLLRSPTTRISQPSSGM